MENWSRGFELSFGRQLPGFQIAPATYTEWQQAGRTAAGRLRTPHKQKGLSEFLLVDQLVKALAYGTEGTSRVGSIRLAARALALKTPGCRENQHGFEISA